MTGGDASADSSADVDGDGSSTADADAGRRSYVEEVTADVPASWWRFGESDPSMPAHDEMGVQSGTYHVPGLALGTAGAIAGDPNTAVSFDATGGYVSLSGSLYDFGGSPPFAIEVWIAPSAPPAADAADTDRRVLSHRTDSPYFGWYLLLQPDQTLSFTRWDQDATVGSLASPPLTTGVFAHVVVSSDGATMTMYVNGAAVAQGAAGTVTPNTPALNLSWGSNSDIDAQFYSGALDEGAIYTHELSAARVLAHYRAGTAP